MVLTVFASSLFSFPHEREKLLQKAQRIKELQHSHLLPIMDIGIAEEQPFVMRGYLPNGSLRSHLKKLSPRGLELGEALSIVAQVGEALLYAHEHNIVHGQVKPENILLDANGQAILTDFSLVDRKDAIIRDQASEEYAFCYMAPEQFAGVCDSRSDQYALGCLAYELITGQVPFASQSLTSMMGRQSNAVPAPLSERVAGLPPALEIAVLKTLAQDPEERFFDFSLFLEVIQSVLSPPPAFPLLRPTYASKNRAASQAVQPAKAGAISSPIRKRAAKHTAPELPDQSRASSGGEGELTESTGAHLVVDTSLPKPTGSISNPESLTSVLQSQLFTSSLSLDVAPLSNKESAIPDHPPQEHKHNEPADFMVGIMPLSQASRAELAMARLITEEAADAVGLTDLFMEEDVSPVRALASLAHEDDESKINKITSVVESNTDVLVPTVRTRRSRRRSLGLVLLLSVIVAVISSGVWFSGIISFSTSSYLSPSTSDDSTANLGANPTAILIHIPKLNLKVLPTAAANFSQNAAIAGSNPNAENASYVPSGTNNGYKSNTTSVSSNPSASNTNSSPATTTSTANSDPYPPSGTLALNDPLSANSRGYGWEEFSPNSSGASCQFEGGAYHSIESQNYYHACHASLQASNFTLEVQMQIIQGNCGGLVLRDTTSQAHAYGFQVCQNGSYALDRLDGFSAGWVTLASSSNGAIKTGLNQSNVIAAVANGSTFDLYINHQMITSVNDSSYTQGQFGLSAEGNTEAVYTNARMWTL